MTKHICPLKTCGRKFISEEFLTAHKALDHVTLDFEFKRRGWATPYGFADYREPVTYSFACAEMKKLCAEMKKLSDEVTHLFKKEPTHEQPQGLHHTDDAPRPGAGDEVRGADGPAQIGEGPDLCPTASVPGAQAEAQGLQRPGLYPSCGGPGSDGLGGECGSAGEQRASEASQVEQAPRELLSNRGGPI